MVRTTLREPAFCGVLRMLRLPRLPVTTRAVVMALFCWGGAEAAGGLVAAGGAEAWEVHASHSEDGDRVSVEVVGHVKPLPLFGAVVSALGTSEEEGVVLRVRVEEDVRSSWVGGDYGNWVGIWG